MMKSSRPSFFELEEQQTKKGPRRKTKKNARRLEGKEACRACKLYKQKGLSNPKLKPYGKNELHGMVIGEGPGEREDETGKPFHPKAPAGGLLHKTLGQFDIVLYRDCVTVNAVDCRPMKGDANRAPESNEIRWCYFRKKRAIEKYEPKVILLLGEKAVSSFYGFENDRRIGLNLGMRSLRGKVVFDRLSNAWVCHSYHPSYIKRGNEDHVSIFRLDVAIFCKLLKNPRQLVEPKGNIKILENYNQVLRMFEKLEACKEFAIDYETTSFRYYERIHELKLVSIAPFESKTVYVFPFDFETEDGTPWWTKKQRKKIKKLLKALLTSNKKKVAQNIKHEDQAARYLLGVETKNWSFDTMLSAHTLDPVSGITGLKAQTYLNYGIPDYSDGISSFLRGGVKQKNSIDKLPYTEVATYCGQDSLFTKALAKKHRKLLAKRQLMPAYKLLHEGAEAFSEVQKNGIKIDIKKAKNFERKWANELDELKDKLLSSKEASRFKRKTRKELSFNKTLSGKDLQVLLFDILKFKPIKQTKTGYSTDATTLETFKDKSEFVSILLRYKKVDKLLNTYLSQFLRYEVDGFIYPTFNLHFAESYRSSSSEPNFQNIPKRSEESKIIRSLIISRWGSEGAVAEVDYSSMEVRIIACVTHDPVLIDYLVGGGDMHGDWGEILFKVGKKEIPKKIFKRLRQGAKNGFVFPNFYGSYWKNTAAGLWDWMPKGMRETWEYEDWVEHVRSCEKKFWKKFHVTREWQDSLVRKYKRTGYVQDSSWGFRRFGYLSRNHIYNFPIQGPAYHCLQWDINEIVLRRDCFKPESIDSLLCGEIHDALFWDMKIKESDKLRKNVDYIMTEQIREENKWLIVPLETEWSVGEKDWSKMKDL